MTKRHEGTGPMQNGRLMPYHDSVGKLTIGYGRNIEDMGVTPEEAMYLLQNDLGRARTQARGAFLWFDSLDLTRQAVLTEMIFNMGLSKVEGFKLMLAAIQAGDFRQAAAEMRNSVWATQVGARALELASLMESGDT